MSEVVSFRLSKDNPREAKAREVLRRLYHDGYSIRHILTEALLLFDTKDEHDPFADVNQALEKIGQMLEGLQKKQVVVAASKTTEPEQPPLSAEFLSSVRQVVKPGMKRG